MPYKALEVQHSYIAAVVAGANEYVDWAIQGLGVEKAWAKTKGDGVLVGILDTGTVSHPNLDANIAFRVGAPDTNGHATHVTGIIAAAEIENGITGIAPKCKVASIQVLPGDGVSIAAGIDKAIELGCQVINMSLGCYDDEQPVRDAVKRAASAGVILVAAAGNNHPASTSYPALYPEVIAVSAIDDDAHEAWFAPDLHDIMSPNHFAMPGVKILSTWLGGQYAKLSGTSQATPILTGLIVLILALRPKPKKGDAVTDAASYVTSELVRISVEVPGTTFREPEGINI